MELSAEDAQRQWQEILGSPRLTPKTREVLLARQSEASKTSYQPRFFSREEFSLLTAIAETVIEDARPETLNFLAAQTDERLFKNEGKGWRYDELPAEREMYQRGLAYLRARVPHFVSCERAEKERHLRETFETRPSQEISWIELFWEELLVDLIETHYSHPETQIRLGAYGMVDDA